MPPTRENGYKQPSAYSKELVLSGCLEENWGWPEQLNLPVEVSM